MDPNTITQRLKHNHETFAALLAGWSETDAQWRPGTDQWSVLEVVNHLADEEVEDFRRRVRQTLTNPELPWPPIDPQGWIMQRAYSNRRFDESCARFFMEREESMRWLESLGSVDWQSTHEHPKFGRFAALDVLQAWLAHDYLHMRQITKLRVAIIQSQLSPTAFVYAAG